MFEKKIDLFNLFITGKSRRLNLNEIPHFLYTVSKFIFFDILKFFSREKTKEIPDFRNKKIAYVDTTNNYEALKFLKNHYDVLFVTSAKSPVNDELIGIFDYLKDSTILGKYLFLLYLSINNKYGIKSYLSILKYYNRDEDHYCFFKDNAPSAIFISNDHEPKSRGLIQAAQLLTIPIFYFQHASVSNRFPPLNFTASFLYGKYSNMIYKTKSCSRGDTYLVGNHKFDIFKHEIKEKANVGEISIVGIAYNELDNLDKIRFLVSSLSMEPNIKKIVVRPHPRDKRELFSKQTDIIDKIIISNSNIESSINFLLKVDLLIAGNSSILLEAALSNVVPVQYSFGEYQSHLNDYYGFISYGVANYMNNYKELIDFITKYDFSAVHPRRKTKYYDASVESDFDYSVEKQIVSILKKNYSIN
ncbi:hypothetical protein LZF95_11490 [Algoriphagus sp. AGSA1]|uniref:hypothetical protein n=1 Tax=Algoriphagus sp. AGSA1 TaxID=2907213 RepID=UPI001F33DE3D|nr:hypothetical protein [Algoriphagus sp. AGSA1]MCE7055300.1 hypothetical protein [Algoriphagus sp. AGSA1]